MNVPVDESGSGNLIDCTNATEQQIGALPYLLLKILTRRLTPKQCAVNPRYWVRTAVLVAPRNTPLLSVKRMNTRFTAGLLSIGAVVVTNTAIDAVLGPA